MQRQELPGHGEADDGTQQGIGTLAQQCMSRQQLQGTVTWDQRIQVGSRLAVDILALRLWGRRQQGEQVSRKLAVLHTASDCIR